MKKAISEYLAPMAAVTAVLIWLLVPSPGLAADDEHGGEQGHAEEIEAHDGAGEHEGHDHGGGEHSEAEAAREAEHAEEVSGHVDEDAHSGHGHEEEEGEVGVLRLNAKQREQYGIALRAAAAGHLADEVEMPGEIVYDADSLAHIVPRVAGIVAEVRKKLGDDVKQGEVLAVIESRELADAKSAFLAAAARTELARKTFLREKTLREKEISSEQEYLEAESALAESEIALRAAEQKLGAIGLSRRQIAELRSPETENITRYEILAPIGGTIIDRNITRGERVEAGHEIFSVAGLEKVWAEFTVYARNLDLVEEGQSVLVRLDRNDAEKRGQIAMVTPFVKLRSRAAIARVVLENEDRKWMPGSFASAFIKVSEEEVPVLVERSAVQRIEGNTVVFLPEGDAFHMAPVVIGRRDREHVEIVSGLEAGTLYVAEGAFALKAGIITSGMGAHAGHGH